MKIMNIKNKNILFIAPKYFGYEEKIKKCLENEGANVYLIYENLDEVSISYRFVYAYMKNQKDKVLTKYYIAKTDKLPEKIDIVFVIRGASLTVEAMDYMKKKFCNSKYYMYQWDSVLNNGNALKIAGYFDSIFTFDMIDAKKQGWSYRPLFFTSQSKIVDKGDIDILYICSLHSKRIQILKEIIAQYSNSDTKLFQYLYSKPFIYLKQKYLDKNEDFIGLPDNVVQHKPLSLEKIENLYRKSRVVVDYTHPNQNGFTMRTIECIGSRCKLVTNNKHIADSNFYNSNNIFIYDENNFRIPKEFIELPYVEMNKELYDYYSLESFIKSIFEEN